jgi:RNA polymerase-binding transcription factor DksA
MSNTRPDVERRLRDDLISAESKFRALEQEYAELLADPGTIQEDRDATRTVMEASRGTLEQAQHALDRFVHGDYGRCEACGKPIGAERLEAIPDASRCVTCAN